MEIEEQEMDKLSDTLNVDCVNWFKGHIASDGETEEIERCGRDESDWVVRVVAG